MPQGIKKYIRKELLSFGAYSAAISPDTLEGKTEVPVEEIIKLDQNENLYGPSPRVSEALSRYYGFNIYPDTEQTILRNQLAKYTGVSPECIVAANGSNQLLDIVTRLFVGAGDNVINCVPTFDIYRFSTQICGGKVIELPRDDNFAIDVKAIKDAIDKKTKIIFLANPNAPTGNLTPEKDIREVLEVGLPTLIDEAYYEFSNVTAIPLMKRYPNLMVVRTFSKWAGLAGLRVGYGLFPPEIADYLHRIKIPYNVNVAALVAVRESMKDIEFLMGRVKEIISQRNRMVIALKKLPWLKVYPSEANFVLSLVLNGRAKELHQKLQDKGILVRYFNKPRLENCIRFSVGKPEQNDAFLTALREIALAW